jgi:glycosyltransferase involved in cell wall biosynthesis
MRVLHVTRTYFPDPPGGIQEAIRQICIASNEIDVKCTVFALSKNPRPPNLNAPESLIQRAKLLFSIASCDVGGISSILKFYKLSREHDLIIYHFPWPFLDILRFFARSSTPSILFYHSDVVRQRWLLLLYRPLMLLTLHKVSSIIVTSQNYLESSSILKSINLRKKIEIIPLGINEKSYAIEEDELIFDRIGIKKNESYFLFIGALRYYKGIDYLLKAAQKISDCKILIAGDGPKMKIFLELSRQLKLNNVIFLGAISNEEKISLIKYSKALLLPSHLRSEAFGVVLLEAAMLSKPMITCEIGTGTSFVNINNQTGIVVEPENPNALADAINSLNTNTLSISMGIEARKRFISHFSGESLKKSYRNLYTKLIKIT